MILTSYKSKFNIHMTNKMNKTRQDKRRNEPETTETQTELGESQRERRERDMRQRQQNEKIDMIEINGWKNENVMVDSSRTSYRQKNNSLQLECDAN